MASRRNIEVANDSRCKGSTVLACRFADLPTLSTPVSHRRQPAPAQQPVRTRAASQLREEQQEAWIPEHSQQAVGWPGGGWPGPNPAHKMATQPASCRQRQPPAPHSQDWKHLPAGCRLLISTMSSQRPAGRRPGSPSFPGWAGRRPSATSREVLGALSSGL